MVFASFSFATMSCIAHAYSATFSWPLVALARIGITWLLVCTLLFHYRLPFLIRGTRELWWRSLCGSMGLACTFYAVTHLPVTDQVTISATGPIWLTVILAVVFRQRMPRSTWAHAALALIGVYIMYRPTFDAASFPVLVALVGAVAGAGAMVSLSLCNAIPNLSVVAHFSSCSTVICLAICTFSPSALVLRPAVGSLSWLGLVPMGAAGMVGQVLITGAYGRGNPTMVALVGISGIAFAAIYDLLVWGYTFDGWKVVGVLLIATSIAMSILMNAGTKKAA